MKKGGTSTPTAADPMNKPAEILNPSATDSMTSDVRRNGNPFCHPFSMRGYVAEMRNTNPKACIPFNDMSENTWEQMRGSLDVPHFRWRRCRNCAREVVPSTSTAAKEILNPEQTTSLPLFILETDQQNSSLELRAAGGSLEGDATKSPVEAIGMVDSDGEKKIPYTCNLELLATVALEEMTSDLPALQESCPRLNPEKDSSFEQRTAGFGTEAVVQAGDKALIDVIDLVHSEDESDVREVRSLQELMKVEEKASAGRGATTHTLQQKEKMASLCKGKNIIAEGQDSIAEDTDKAPVEVIILDDNDEDEGVTEITHSAKDQELIRVEETLRHTQRWSCLDKGKNIIIEFEDIIAGDPEKAPSEVIILDDSDDEEVIKITRSQDQELKRVEEKASSGVSVTTYIPQQTEKRPSLDKGKTIMIEVQGQEFVTPQGTGKAKRSCPFSPNTETVSRKNAKATGSFARPQLHQNRGKSNGGK